MFVKKEILQRKKFDETLIFSEDAKLLQEILMDNPRYGVVSGVRYFYRRRSGGETSLATDLIEKEYYYLPNLKGFLFPLANYAIEKFNYIPRFVQFTIMYCIQWMYLIDLEIVNNVLSKEEVDEYLSLLYDLLLYIDDEVIISQKNIQVEDKAFLIAKKNNSKVGLRTIEDVSIKFPVVANKQEYLYNVLNGFRTDVVANGHRFIELRRCKNVLEFISVRNDKLFIEGYTTFMGIDESTDVKIYLTIDDEKFFLCKINSQRDVSKNI